jgi:hypothetical protein
MSSISDPRPVLRRVVTFAALVLGIVAALKLIVSFGATAIPPFYTGPGPPGYLAPPSTFRTEVFGVPVPDWVASLATPPPHRLPRLWLELLAYSALPAWWVTDRLATGARRRLVATRTRRGLCVSCGYDLRCSKSKCPECGATGSTSGRAGESPGG